MARVYLGLGSNIEPEKNLRLGVHELSGRYGDLDVSAVYQSAAVGFEGPDFLNLVVGLDTEASPAEVHEQIEAIHNMAGRNRNEKKFSSRPLDIDLLLYNDLVADESPLRLPRSDILEYSFVVRPLAELAPALVHPVTGLTMAEHWRMFDQESHPLMPVNVAL
jgi:2-amino-4-hydroxy-6-hydroxymethyldihydropteridine diphosphokinase